MRKAATIDFMVNLFKFNQPEGSRLKIFKCISMVVVAQLVMEVACREILVGSGIY